MTPPYMFRRIGEATPTLLVDEYDAIFGPKADKANEVRPWQAELIGGVFDEPRPRLGLWSLPRGNGKSTLAAALGLYGLHGDDVEGAALRGRRELDPHPRG